MPNLEILSALLNKNIKKKLTDGTIEFQDDTDLMKSLLGSDQEKKTVEPKAETEAEPDIGSGSFTKIPGLDRVKQVLGALKNVSTSVGGGAKVVGRSLGGAAKKFVEVADDPEQSPGLSRLLGTIGASLSAVEPQSFQHQLSRAGIESSAGKQAELLREGKELSGIGSFGLSPQERASIVRESLQERQVGAAETTAGAAELASAVSAKESISGKDRLDLEYAKLNQPGGPGKLVDVAINQDGTLSDRLHTYEWNSATGKFDKYVGPKLEPGAGTAGAGKEVERFKPLTIEERKTRLENVTGEANRFLAAGGAEQPGFWVDDNWEKGALIKHAQKKSNPFDEGTDKWTRFETARPYMDLMLALEDVKDKADVTEAEGKRLLDIQNNIDTLRDLSDEDYAQYSKRVQDGADPGELLTLFRQSTGGR